MLVTMENLAEMLEVTPNTLINWEFGLGLNIKTDDSGAKKYSQELINFFKKVKSLILNGYTLASIKEVLSAEIERQNQTIDSIEAIIVEESECTIQDTTIFINDDELNSTKKNNHSSQEQFSSFKDSTKNTDSSKSDVIVLFETILKELKQYTERTIEAEKKVYLLEDYETRVKQDYFELSSEVKQLKVQLDEKDKKIKDYEEQKKRLNLMEVQLKIMQLEKNKKKFWEFWK